MGSVDPISEWGSARPGHLGQEAGGGRRWPFGANHKDRRTSSCGPYSGDDPILGAPSELCQPCTRNPLRPSHVLLLFSGPRDRHDTLSAALHGLGVPSRSIDSDPSHAGGWDEDILNDTVFNELHSLIRTRTFSAVHAAPPCSTFSVARFYSTDDGPPPVRTRDHPDGLPPRLVPAAHATELQRANEILRRTCVLLTAAHHSNAHITLENPCDRSDPESPLFTHAQHGSLWSTSWYSTLAQTASLRTVTFAQCKLGSDYQKYTSIAYSESLHPHLGPLGSLACDHPPGTHKLRAGGREPDGTSRPHTSKAISKKTSASTRAPRPASRKRTRPATASTGAS